MGLLRLLLPFAFFLLPSSAAAGSPVGSAYLRTFPLEKPPFGQLQVESFPWDGARVQRWHRDNAPADWVIVWLDLCTPGLDYHATPVQREELPDSTIKQSAIAQNTVEFLRQFSKDPRVDLAINTVAFYPVPVTVGTRIHLSEPLWTKDDNQRDPQPGSVMLGLLPGRALIGDAATVRAAQPVYAVGSFLDNDNIPGGVAVRAGGVATFANTKVHGRTAAGVSKDGRVLILLIADGYNKGVSEGLSLADAARILQAAGAHEGMFLDGGGSATLVGRGDDGEPLLLNRPAGVLNTPGTLRPIAVSLGFTGLRRSDEPIPAVQDWEAAWYVVL
ncbi:MAG TPA: phosphodiester glycosidase family protein, partial [Gemmataceae bacterium]|nr:phosphodiester glycosidase family protein [Gemmataceae bacterium]